MLLLERQFIQVSFFNQLFAEGKIPKCLKSKTRFNLGKFMSDSDRDDIGSPSHCWNPQEKRYEQTICRSRLQSRPVTSWNLGDSVQKQLEKPAAKGLQPLEVSRGNRDGLIYIPSSYDAEKPSSLFVMLHGAGSNAKQGVSPLISIAEERNLIVLGPDSRGSTWDVIQHAYGPDVAFIDQALQKVFQEYSVDNSRIVIGGFSDGASYALSLGISNGLLFSHIVAFSPGFMRPPRYEDAPEIFISHGVHDSVLNIDYCSRRLVPRLQKSGYKIVYREFDGGHVVPPGIVKEAVDWFSCD